MSDNPSEDFFKKNCVRLVPLAASGFKFAEAKKRFRCLDAKGNEVVDMAALFNDEWRQAIEPKLTPLAARPAPQ
jgi:hypothetical protein